MLLIMLSDRKAYQPNESEMPKVGFIVLEQDTPIAAAFLRKVEGGYGQVDGLTSNPHVESSKRHTALNLCINKCVEAAKDQGMRTVIGFCLDNTTTSRAESLGFVKQPHSLVVYNLKE